MPIKRKRTPWRALALLLLFLTVVYAWPRRSLLFLVWSFRHEPMTMEMPVVGVDAARLVSTFGAPRSGGRQHQGADIFSARGTHVVSATRGVCTRIGHDSLGGKVIWVVGEGPAAYYYAHLDDWAPDLKVGKRVNPGQLLGYVGNTGNARTTPPHLHFGIYRLGLFNLSAIDPVPLLQSRVAGTTGAGFPFALAEGTVGTASSLDSLSLTHRFPVSFL